MDYDSRKPIKPYNRIRSLVPKLKLGNAVLEAPASCFAKPELRFEVPNLEIGNQHKLGRKLKINKMAMATMTISVPDPMKDWVQSQVETGTYANTSDYIRDLIRKDQENRSKITALQKAITEGLESGISNKSFDEIINEARQELKDHQ